MAGRLVGEVMNGARTLRARGLSKTAVLAAVVIAEECREPSRLGRVGRERIIDVLGCTPRTATRLVDELREHRVVTLVEPGRRGRVSLFRLELLPVDRPEEGTPEHPSLVDSETPEHPNPHSSEPDSGTSGPDSGALLTEYGDTTAPLPVPEGSRRDARATDSPPARRCAAHLYDANPPSCGSCADARRARELWLADAAARRLACPWCDEGWLVDPESGAPIVQCDHRTDPARQVADAPRRHLVS